MAKEDRVEKLTGLNDGQGVAVGKRFVLRFQHGACLALTHPESGVYHVNASWLVNESYDDDPGSRTCDCDLAFNAHLHARRDFQSYAEAVEAFATAEQEIIARRPVRSLPRQWSRAA